MQAPEISLSCSAKHDCDQPFSTRRRDNISPTDSDKSTLHFRYEGRLVEQRQQQRQDRVAVAPWFRFCWMLVILGSTCWPIRPDVVWCPSSVVREWGMATASMRFFGSELRRAREAVGVTQKQLAEAVHYSESKVGAVERGEQLASPALAFKADEYLKTDGLFARMRDELLTVEATPEWFRPWVDYEREAIEIGWYEPLLVPGLLQIGDYARALLRDGSPGQADSLLAARLERQHVLERAQVVAIIDEQVLRRRVGTAETMCQQLQHLTEVPAVVQVLPSEAETYRHLEGSFALALVDGMEVGYVDTPARGFMLDTPEVVSRMRRRWEAIRAEALPRGQSKSFILRVAEEWKHGS